MRAGTIAQMTPNQIPAYKRAEMVFDAERIHVGAAVERVQRKIGAAGRWRNGVRVQNARTRRARRRVGVSPGAADVQFANRLRRAHKVPIARTLVERSNRMLSAQHLIDSIELQLADHVVKPIAAACLCSPLVGDADRAWRHDQDAAIAQRGDSLVTEPVGPFVQFVRTDRGKRPLVVSQRDAVEIAVRTIRATFRRGSKRETAAAAARRGARAIEVAISEITVVSCRILARRHHDRSLEAIPDR